MQYFYFVVLTLAVALGMHFILWALRRQILDLILMVGFICMVFVYGLQSILADCCNTILGTKYTRWIDQIA